jgi:circadian clock protein KaiB
MVPSPKADSWKFELYIIGDNRRSTMVMDNLRGICREHLGGQCRVDVYDVKEHPELISERKLCVTPTLVKKYPLPEKTLVGDLSLTKKVLEGLNIKPPGTAAVGDGGYREGLRRQNRTFILQHIPSRR